MWPTLVTPRSCNREDSHHGCQEGGPGQRALQMGLHSRPFPLCFLSTNEGKSDNSGTDGNGTITGTLSTLFPCPP